jgi:hypothetical protein
MKDTSNVFTGHRSSKAFHGASPSTSDIPRGKVSSLTTANSYDNVKIPFNSGTDPIRRSGKKK